MRGMHEPRSTRAHKSEAHRGISFAVLTVSTSKYRGMGEDVSGSVLTGMIKERGYKVVRHDVVSDDEVMIKEKVLGYIDDDEVNAVVTTGGSGISTTDVTINAMRPVFEKEIEGFNPLFIKLSHDEIGSACVLSRATAGIVCGKVVFCLPGSPDACRLAMDKIILAEVEHILKHTGE